MNKGMNISLFNILKQKKGRELIYAPGMVNTMNKKYELLKDDTYKKSVIVNGEYEYITLYRIRALKNFRTIKVGDLGGYVESERNLSHDGICWIYKGYVYENAKIYDNALVNGCDVCDDSRIFGDACVYDSKVYGSAKIYGNACVYDSKVRGSAKIYGNAYVYDCLITGKVEIFDNARVDCVEVYNTVKIYNNSIVTSVQYEYVDEYTVIKGCAEIYGNSKVCSCNIKDCKVKDYACLISCDIDGDYTICGNSTLMYVDTYYIPNYDNISVYDNVRYIGGEKIEIL